MRQGEFLGSAFDIRTHVFELLVDTPLDVKLLEVDAVVRVGCDLLVGVQFPGIGLGLLYADLEAVVLDDACEACRQTTVADKLLDSFLYLRT